MISSLIVSLTALLAFIAIGYKCLIIIDKNEQAVVERLAKFDRVIGEGVHLIIPFIEKLHGIEDPYNHKKFLNNGKISLEPDVISFPKDDREFFGKDKARMKLKADIVYKITDPYKAVYEAAYLFDALNQLFAGILQKRLIDADEGTNSAECLRDLTRSIIDIANEYAQNWGIKILEFNLKQITDGNGIRHNY